MVSSKQSIEEFQRLINHLALSYPEINRAMVLALNKTIKRIMLLSSRNISKDLRLRLNIIQNRMKAYKANRRKKVASLYQMIFDVPAIILGEPVKTSRGIRVGEHHFDGAFLVHGWDRDRIMKRLYRTRYPISEVKIPVEKTTKLEFARQSLEVEELFNKIFSQELERIGHKKYAKSARSI